MIRLHNLRPRPGARHRVKRLGIGESSGHGKTSGKGNKGQKARSGGSIRLGFEGGQMPLIRRLPKRGFNNAAFRTEYAIVNLDELNEFEAGSTINEQILRESKHIRGDLAGLKILGRGELKHGLTIEADKVSRSAREKIEKAGGTVTLRERKAAADGGRGEAPKTEEDAAAKKSPKAKTKAKAKAGKPAAKKKSTK
jgi:large subunit ribosomal protein L15